MRQWSLNTNKAVLDIYRVLPKAQFCCNGFLRNLCNFRFIQMQQSIFPIKSQKRLCWQFPRDSALRFQFTPPLGSLIYHFSLPFGAKQQVMLHTTLGCFKLKRICWELVCCLPTLCYYIQRQFMSLFWAIQHSRLWHCDIVHNRPAENFEVSKAKITLNIWAKSRATANLRTLGSHFRWATK